MKARPIDRQGRPGGAAVPCEACRNHERLQLRDGEAEALEAVQAVRPPIPRGDPLSCEASGRAS
ncbi:hypothetical protein MAF45_08535 [Mesosutterella sp. OilRF-GAM-744-9]|uniref:Uncharacterized protein n=1 Tax=Mesosutterella porci TaxID=2915351 RepID=A0ABS9MS82_9BURK|nr:hypothetical protein [Mesosutterella sp. oilRF-744-WT-GAM-9]MCG5031486.1 hypothetical protein [Mesosutterella sp. oilRF-744-WT-GAM-9]